MRLGTRQAGIRLERARWGMPARLTLYGGFDPFAGPGSIPWRHYWVRELRWPTPNPKGLPMFTEDERNWWWVAVVFCLLAWAAVFALAGVVADRLPQARTCLPLRDQPACTTVSGVASGGGAVVQTP